MGSLARGHKQAHADTHSHALPRAPIGDEVVDERTREPVKVRHVVHLRVREMGIRLGNRDPYPTRSTSKIQIKPERFGDGLTETGGCLCALYRVRTS